MKRPLVAGEDSIFSLPPRSDTSLVPDIGQDAASGVRTVRLQLKHPVFRTFKDPYFRLSDAARKPVFVIQLDDDEAELPFDNMMKEFAIAADEHDGKMLSLVLSSLDFVTGLRVGDPIPPEVLTGKASWTIDDIHRDLAIARLNVHLLAGRSDRSTDGLRKDTLTSAISNPISGDEIRVRLNCIAKQIGRISPEEALVRIDDLADELAYVEALRDRLLRGALRMGTVLNRLARSFNGDSTHKEVLVQIRRLSTKGIEDIQARFEEVDCCLSNIVRAVQDPATAIALIRNRRDGLFRRWRAWEPYTREWGTIDIGQTTRIWHLANETYRFLAPRYMTLVEWRSATQTPEAKRPAPTGMTW